MVHRQLVLALCLTAYEVLGNSCEPGWLYSPHSRACYKLFEEHVGWVKAEFACVFKNAHLPSIHSAEQNRFLTELAAHAGIVWTGFALFGGSTEYVWSDHSPPSSFENWDTGRRPPYNKAKKCSKLNGHTGHWEQSCCKIPAAYICEKAAS